MIRIKWLSFLFIITIFSSFSCRNNDTINSDNRNYASGVLVTNRGDLFNPISTISHYNRENNFLANTVYQRANADTLYGTAKSIMAHQSRVYIVMNDPDRIEVVNQRDFTRITTIYGLTDPKFIHAVSLNKLYISQWGADGLSGSVQIYNLTTESIVDSIPTGRGPGPMVQVGNSVYVANSGGILTDSTVAIINTASDNVVDFIDVGINPTHLAVDQNNSVWSLSKGIIFQNPPNVDGKLSRIVGNEVTYQHDVTAGAANLAFNGDKDLLYYVMNGWTYTHDINSNFLNTTPFIQKYFWGIGVDPETDDLWGSDPLNFSAPGDIYIYDENGQEIDIYGAGVIPETFLFQ